MARPAYSDGGVTGIGPPVLMTLPLSALQGFFLDGSDPATDAARLHMTSGVNYVTTVSYNEFHKALGRSLRQGLADALGDLP